MEIFYKSYKNIIHRLHLFSSLIIVCICLNSGFAQISESITFNNNGLSLYGTLSFADSNYKYPLVILVHGSGPSDRDQTVTLTGGNAQCIYPDIYGNTLKNLKDISEQLVDNNYAVFRYDKRTYTHSNLNLQTITIFDFISDAEAAVEQLKGHRNVDSSCIVLLGHSQGATLIPLVKHSSVTHLISLAGHKTPIDTIYTEQIRDLYYKCLNDTAQGDSAADTTYQDFYSIRNGTYPPNQAFMGAYPPFWKSWIDVTDSTLYNYESKNLPSLFLQGKNDFNVPYPELNFFSDSLSNPANDYLLFDSINHFGTYYGNHIFDTSITIEIVKWLGKSPTLLTSLKKQEFNDLYGLISRYENTLFISKKINVRELKIYDYSGRLILVKQGNTEIINLPNNTKNQIIITQIMLNDGKVFTKKL